jgi:hypothetical protein
MVDRTLSVIPAQPHLLPAREDDILRYAGIFGVIGSL